MFLQGRPWQHNAVLPGDNGAFQAASALSCPADSREPAVKARSVQVVRACNQPVPNIAVLPVDRGPHSAARAQGWQPAGGTCPGAAGAEPGPGCSGVAEEHSSQGAGGAGCPADSQCQLQVSGCYQAEVDCIPERQLDACQQVLSQLWCFRLHLQCTDGAQALQRVLCLVVLGKVSRLNQDSSIIRFLIVCQSAWPPAVCSVRMLVVCMASQQPASFSGPDHAATPGGLQSSNLHSVLHQLQHSYKDLRAAWRRWCAADTQTPGGKSLRLNGAIIVCRDDMREYWAWGYKAHEQHLHAACRNAVQNNCRALEATQRSHIVMPAV